MRTRQEATQRKYDLTASVGKISSSFFSVLRLTHANNITKQKINQELCQNRKYIKLKWVGGFFISIFNF